MNIFMRTQAFDRWLKKLKGPAAKAMKKRMEEEAWTD